LFDPGFKESDHGFCRLATAAAFASLLSYSIVLLITPAALNEVKRTYAESLTQLGMLQPTMMAGFFTAVIWAGGYSDRRGKLPTLVMGCSAMAAGTLAFGCAPTFALSLAATLLMGIGGGLCESTSMALLGDLYADSMRTSMMNLSQALFGLGAVVSPLAIGALLRAGLNWRLGYFGAAAVCAASAIISLVAMEMRRERIGEPKAREDGWRKLIRDRLVLWLSLGILLYVGAEIGLSNWLSVYFKTELGAPGPQAAASLSFLWVGIGAGRIVAARFAKYVSDFGLVCWTLGLSAGLAAGLVLCRTPIPALATAFALGFCFGPIFPTIVSRAGAAHTDQSGTVTSMVVACASVGAAVFPPVIGRAADSFGLRHALWICVAVLAIDLGMFVWIWARGAQRRKLCRTSTDLV
jgi:fucose permease